MYCCGHERLTPFCSMCGKAMNEKPIYELLRHVKRYRDSVEADLEANKAIHGEDGKKIQQVGNLEYRNRLKHRFDKWDRRHKALIELIQKTEEQSCKSRKS